MYITKVTKKNDNTNDEHKENFLKKNSSIVIIVMFIMVIIFRSFFIDRVIIHGKSMSTTFNENDVCWVKKIDYEINRDDVVVASVDGKNVIKRIAAIPGDSIQIINGNLYINEQEYSGEYAYETTDEGIASEQIFLKEDEYFLLGDNREESYDSRYYGSVKKKNIKGIVIAKIYPNFEIMR